MRTLRNVSQDDLEAAELAEPAFQLFHRPVTRNHYDVRISTPIGNPEDYDELCQLFLEADEEDTVRIYLNTPGGDFTTGLTLINAMRVSAAHITAVLYPQAFSMGALIFLAADDWEVPPNSMLMLHNYSSGLQGKGNEQVAHVQATSAWFEKVLADVTANFLTKTEQKGVLQGKDLWLQSDTILKRLEGVRAARSIATSADA